MVYVQDINGTPLMPTTRGNRVRHLLKNKEAVVVCTYPFTIRLTTSKPRQTQEVSLGKVLNAHHIESRKVGGNAPNNLITLCETCHDAYHRGGIKLKVKRGQPLRDAAGMNMMKDRLYDAIKSENLDISVRYTYGYKTKYNRVRYGISKSHASDAQVISGNYTAEPCDEFIEMRQLRRHNRQIHKSNICKGGKLKRNQSEYCVKGFRLWDVVRYRGGLWLIKGKRTSGMMTITSLTDSTLKIDGVTCKKFRLVSIANRLRILIYKAPVGGAIHLRN